jgi:hypothetical protein
MTALILAIIGIVLSVASLGWQAWTWSRSGPHVVVTAANTWPVYAGQLGAWHVSVTATNNGRAPITIDGWGFELPDKSDFIEMRPPAWATTLPYRLEPHSHASWMMEVDDLKSSCAGRGVTVADLRPWVRAAGVGKIYSKARAPVSD